MIIEFIQGDSESSTEHPLFSADHDNCHCVIAVNLDSGEAHMFHVWEGAFVGLSPWQKESAEEFVSRPGKKVGVAITGSRCITMGDTHITLAQEFLQELGIDFAPPIDVKSGDKTWDVLFHPVTKEVRVTETNGGVLYEGTLFTAPDYSTSCASAPDTGLDPVFNEPS